jgi:hypothetical protein
VNETNEEEHLLLWWKGRRWKEGEGKVEGEWKEDGGKVEGGWKEGGVRGGEGGERKMA